MLSYAGGLSYTGRTLKGYAGRILKGDEKEAKWGILRKHELLSSGLKKYSSQRWQIGRKSGDVMETWEEEGFQDEAVTTVQRRG